jgi:hypothetical protein
VKSVPRGPSAVDIRQLVKSCVGGDTLTIAKVASRISRNTRCNVDETFSKVLCNNDVQISVSLP